MIERFQIEDIVVQDSTGVLFRALDTQTDKPVALRRLFPRGPEGGGLNASEQATYQAAVERLAGVEHPSLRAVHCGGCDPVDGMPFIVTEWVEGARLQAFLDHAPLKPEEAIDLLTKALEVAGLVAGVLGEEGVWIETGPNTIVVGSEESGRGVTFWISPVRWLTREQRPGLQAIATLTETIMGWTGRSVADSAAHGLGGWLKWLRAHSDTATIREAREKLAGSIGLQAPPVVKNPVPTQVSRAQPTRKVVPTVKQAGGVKPKKSSAVPAFIGAMVFLGVMAGGGWWLVKWNSTRLAKEAETRTGAVPVIVGMAPTNTAEAGEVAAVPAAAADSQLEAPVSPSEIASAEPRKASEPATVKEENPKPTAPKEAKAATQPETADAGKIYTAADRDVIAKKEGQAILFEGTFQKIGYSKSGKTRYLFFSLNPTEREPRGAIAQKDTTEDLSEPVLMALQGKKLQLRGKVKMDGERPWVEVRKRADIKVIE